MLGRSRRASFLGASVAPASPAPGPCWPQVECIVKYGLIPGHQAACFPQLRLMQCRSPPATYCSCTVGGRGGCGWQLSSARPSTGATLNLEDLCCLHGVQGC